MKKRLLSLVLAASMLLGSVNVAFADETSIPVEPTTEVSDEIEVSEATDVVESGGAIEESSSETTTEAKSESTGINWNTTSPWLATVYGDAGGQTKIDNYGDPDFPEFKKYSGETVYPYDVVENGNEVNIRMGNTNTADDGSGPEKVGKIASSSDGRVMYFRQVTAEDDFTISATAHINSLLTTDNQVSFGAAVIDEIKPLENYSSNSDSINAGIRQINNATTSSDVTQMAYSWVRAGGAIQDFKFENKDSKIPAAGDDIKISIRKSGNSYKVRFGDESAEFSAADVNVNMSGDIYVGFYASRCADITFKNVSMFVAGEPVEVGPWETDGNGLNGKDDKKGLANCIANKDNSEIDLSLTGDVGKFSKDEDSYSYRAMQAPAGVDFKVTSTIDAISITPDGTKKQAASGFIIFDKHYVKGVDGQTGNSLFVGLITEDEVNAKLVCRINKNGEITTTELPTNGIKINGVGSESGPFDLKVIKSGDNVKIKIGNNDAVDIAVGDMFENNEYIGYAIARAGRVNVTNNKVEVGAKRVTNVVINSMPEKLNYYSTEKFDTTGLALDVTYADGSTELINNPDDYAVTGFDDAAGKYFTTPGERTVTVSVGAKSVEIPVNVRPMNVIGLNIDYAPIYDTFYEGGKLNTVGLQVTAKYENGTSKKLSTNEMVFTMGGKEIVPDKTILTSDEVGEDLAVIVKHSDSDETINPNGVSSAFYIAVKPGKISRIKIYSREYKTTYYVGDELDTKGLEVKGIYVDSNGKESTQYLTSSQYEVVGLDTSKPADEQILTVRYLDDPSLTDSYKVRVLNPEPIKVKVEGYPRFTFVQGEAFDITGLVYGVLYTNNEIVNLCEDAYYFKNGTEYYMVFNKAATYNGVEYSKGDRLDLTEAEVLDADFYIDLSEYDSSAVGTTKVTVYLNSKYGVAAVNPTVWNITIVNNTDYIWKGTLFGASCMGASGNADAESSSITVNYAGGTSAVTDDRQYGVKPDLMENGVLSDVDSVRVRSWTGSGKISGDQDGVAYYYTNVDAKKNFTISADITVNDYIFDPNNLTGEQKKKYDANIAAGDSPSVALDKLRSGQEAFGIMARDIVPFAGGIDADGAYTGGATNHMTPLASDALTKDYEFTKADGSTVVYTTPVDLLEAYLNNLKAVDSNNKTYAVSSANVEAQIASNIVIAGGCSDSTWPTDPNSSSYYKKTVMNRINIMTRCGVVSTSSGGKRVGIYSTTDKLPEKGEKYNITLTKMNTGYMITTYDYQTNKTVTKYSFESEDDTEDVLEIQDADNIYVGFFASRYADCTVENIELHETDPATDPNITASVNEAVAPKVTISSPYYTTYTKYGLRMKSNATKGMTGGVTNVSMNGKTVIKDTILGSTVNVYDVELEPDTINQFSVVYYPNTADNFTSYDPVITRFTVTHKSMSDTSKIYVGPTGSVAGDGSRDNPLNLETALGLVGFGGEVIMLDGTYNVTNTDEGSIEIPATYSGYENGNFKTLRAEEGATPIIDLEEKYAGFNVDADYWYFKGLTVINSVDNEKCFGLAGMHCVVEDCTFYDAGTTGFQISRINSSDATIYTWPSYNVVKSCESFNNCDPSKNNADGFAAKLTVGYGNVFEDCISHHNLDDGWDCYTKLNSGAIGAVVLENCISYKQGYQLLDDGTDKDWDATSGGNGYKLGGEGIYVEHMLKDCISFNNKATGIDTNNNPALTVRNVIAYNNYSYNFRLYSNTANSLKDADGNVMDADGRVYKFNYDLKGAVSVGKRDEIGAWNAETEYANVAVNPVDSESNYLNKSDKQTSPVNSLGETIDVKTFFKSTDPNSSMINQRYQRAEDGSFIHGDFLARTEEYVHDAADIVTLPDVYGGKGGVGVNTDTTEETTSEVTTKTPSKGSSGAGGGGSVKNYVATTTTTEATTVSEATTETTTEAVILNAAVAVKVGDKNITIDDNSYAMDVAPYIQATSNSTMVPLRFVAIALAGGDVESADNSDAIVWDAVAKTATITAGSNTVVFTAGSGTYTVNGNTLNISNKAVAEIVDGRMFVPFRTIGEAFGAKVSWDANTKTAMYN